MYTHDDLSDRVKPWFVALAIVVALSSCQKTHNTSETQAEVAENATSNQAGPKPAPAAKQPQATHRSAREAILASYEANGLDSGKSLDVYTQVVATCEDGLLGREMKANDSRFPAREKLLELCSGFSSDQLPKPTAEYRNFMTESADAQSIQQAQIALSSQTISNFERVSAAAFLIREGKFPNQESYAGSNVELIEAFAAASALKKCRTEGCGPNGLEVLTLCSTQGCDPSLDYESAFKSVTSPRKLELVKRLTAF